MEPLGARDTKAIFIHLEILPSGHLLGAHGRSEVRARDPREHP